MFKVNCNVQYRHQNDAYFTPCSSVSFSSVSVINVSIVSIVNLELENAGLAVAIFQPFNHSLVSTSHLLLAVTMKKAYWKVIVELV